MARKVGLAFIVVALFTALFVPQVASATSSFCAGYVFNDVASSGFTNGNWGNVEAGDTFTFTFTLGSATTFSARIVGDPSGSPTYAGPFTSPGTYSYTFSAAASVGIGYYIDSADGTVNVTASCSGQSASTGPILPANANLVLITKTTAVLDAPGGNPVPNTTLFAGQTAFVTSISEDGKYGLVFVMGGWIKLADTLDVAENYGQ